MMEDIFGKIGLKPYYHENGICKSMKSRRVIWEIKLAINEERHDVTLMVSNWSYMSEIAAINAAKKWADRLGIIIVDKCKKHCCCCC